MPDILEINRLCKTYAKPHRKALDHVSLTVESGSIFAFVGPNGAGKTTAIRIMATLLAYDSGNVRVCGYEIPASKHEIRKHIGYIPDEFGFYVDMEVCEYLSFFASCYDIDANRQTALISDLLELVGLAERRNDPVRSLSRGLQQRLALARALINDPELIIADEPAANLDPRARFELREMFVLLREMGKTIFLSSHILRELDDIATHMGIIENGRIVVSGAVDNVRQMLFTQLKVRLLLLGDMDNAQAWLTQHPVVKHVYPADDDNAGSISEYKYPALILLVDGDENTVSELLAEMIGMKFPVYSLTVEQDSMERIFLQLTHTNTG
jgi:ABC-2 type transport system ATP-binding protein